MTVFNIPKISCGHCKSSIESKVSAVDGVESVEVNIDDKTATVIGSASNDDLVAAIDKAGYEVASIS